MALGYRHGMPGGKRPTTKDAMTARRALLDGLARDAGMFEAPGALAALHPRNSTLFPPSIALANAGVSCFKEPGPGLLTGLGRLRPAREVGSVLLEVDLPDEWPPGLGLAVAAMIRRSLRDGFPVVVPIRQDATPEELEAALGAVTRVIQEAGLAA